MLLLGACGKKDEPAATSQSGQSSSGGTAAPTTKAGGGTPSDTSKTTGTATKGTSVANASIDQTVWYEGFKIALGSSSYDKEEGYWTIDAEVENLGDSNASFYGSNIALEDGNTQVETGQVIESPTVLAKAKGKTKIRFSADDELIAKLGSLTLVMGNGTQQQVRVPLDGSTATTLKPVPQESIKGDFVVGQVTLTPSAAEVRYDDPNNHAQADKGKVYLFIVGKAKNASDNTLYFDRAGASLTMPDASKGPAEQFESKDGFEATKTVDFRLNYIISDPYAGDYSLAMTQNWGPEGEAATGTVKFALVSSASGTTPGSTPGTTAKK